MSYRLQALAEKAKELGIKKDDLKGLPKEIHFPVRGISRELRNAGVLAISTRLHRDINQYDTGPLYSVFMACLGDD